MGILKQTGTQVIATGDVDIYIAMQYESHNCLILGDEIETIGIFDIDPHGKDTIKNLLLPAMIKMHPTSYKQVTYKNENHIQATFHKGDVFIETLEIVKAENLAFVVFNEMLIGGKMPQNIPYEKLSFIFDKITSATGINLQVVHSIYELYFAHLCVDQTNTNKKFRHTPMKTPYGYIPIRNISHAASSTVAKVVGAYQNAGINAAIAYPAENNSVIEDLITR